MLESMEAAYSGEPSHSHARSFLKLYCSFGLSYLESVLLMKLAQRTPVVEQEDMVDVSKLSPSDLLTMAKHSMDRNNLARAVQYVTLLKGEPSRVVEDWLVEARVTLETKQAS